MVLSQACFCIGYITATEKSHHSMSSLEILLMCYNKCLCCSLAINTFIFFEYPNFGACRRPANVNAGLTVALFSDDSTEVSIFVSSLVPELSCAKHQLTKPAKPKWGTTSFVLSSGSA